MVVDEVTPGGTNGWSGVVKEVLQFVWDRDKVVQLLRETKNDQGFTPLHLAFGQGHSSVVKEVLQFVRDKQKVDIELLSVRANDGSTPLDVAVMFNHKHMVDMFK